MESPRDTKTDKHESSSEKHDKLLELECELQKLSSENNRLLTENNSLRSILKDYEIIKTNESCLLDKIESLESYTKTLESNINDYKQEISNLTALNTTIEKELSRSKRDEELTSSNLETKIRLLKEALNKRNEDIKEIEKRNEELIEVLAK